MTPQEIAEQLKLVQAVKEADFNNEFWSKANIVIAFITATTGLTAAQFKKISEANKVYFNERDNFSCKPLYFNKFKVKHRLSSLSKKYNKYGKYNLLAERLEKVNIYLLVPTALLAVLTYAYSSLAGSAKDELYDFKERKSNELISKLQLKSDSAVRDAAIANLAVKKAESVIAVANLKADSAKAISNIAIKGQTQLQIDLSKANKERAIAEIKLLDMQKHLFFRKLSSKQKEDLKEIIKSYRIFNKIMVGSIVFGFAPGDLEAQEYALDFANIFNGLGWTVQAAPTIGGGVSSGISISCNKNWDGSYGNPYYIKQAFDRIGIESQVILKDTDQSDKILVYIGPKPSITIQR